MKLTITCGIDWAEDHHDVALVDETGKLVLMHHRRLARDYENPPPTAQPP